MDTANSSVIDCGMKTILADNFNSSDRTYPFTDGEVVPGVIVTSRSVSFIGQCGPVKEVGINGCQIDDMIKFARLTIEVFNAKFPCRENALAITKLEEAEMWLRRRTENRIARGVEGTNAK